MPPFYDEIAEYRLLGALTENAEEVLKITEELFTGDRVHIYRAMREAYLKYGEISSEGVYQFYTQPIPGEIEASRGVKSEALFDRLLDLATRRQLAKLSEQITLSLSQPKLDRLALAQLLELKPLIAKEDCDLSVGISNFVFDFQRKESGLYRFVATGIPFLDHMLGGEWPRQGLAVIMGESGSGKTAIVGQSMLNMARLGIPVGMVSKEMPRSKLVARFVANMANVNGLSIKQGRVTDEEKGRMNEAIEELQTLPIYIEDDPDVDINGVLYRVQMQRAKYGIEAFFVDYLQIIPIKSTSTHDRGDELLGHVTQQIRNVAVKEDIAAIALSQKNREFRGLKSLLGSGKIGNIADTVIEISTDVNNTNEDIRPCTLEFWKNRDGPVGSFSMLYLPKYLRFK